MSTTITRYGMEFFQNFFRLRDQTDRERGLSAIEHAILNGTPDHEVRKMIREERPMVEFKEIARLARKKRLATMVDVALDKDSLPTAALSIPRRLAQNASAGATTAGK